MKLTGGILLLIVLFFSIHSKKEDISRITNPTLVAEIHEVIPKIIDFKDTLLNDTLFIHYDLQQNPVNYSRNIFTGVCIDGECRLVKINLLWNITGRYLGFVLPNGEFLSKTEHDPFTSQEYDKLHELLADALSPLANYSIKELVPDIDTTNQQVDAVSSATIAAVLDHIVEGAVYTTYTLWHIVYGSTKREIEKLTTEQLNSELVLKILNSNTLSDKIWVLNHISESMEISTELQSELTRYISGDDVYLAERSLNAIKTGALSQNLQLQLATIFKETGFLQKRLILQKLKEANTLNPEIVELLTSEIKHLNGSLTKSVLELYKVHNIEDEFAILEIAKLLKHENRYISNQAFHYLESLNTLDKKTQKSVNKFKKSNS